MIQYHKEICNFFGSEIFHKPNYILRQKSYEYHNINIGLFCVNDTGMEGYLMGTHRYLRTRKENITKMLSS